jgi:hypothetical protein
MIVYNTMGFDEYSTLSIFSMKGAKGAKFRRMVRQQTKGEEADEN